MSSAGFVFFDAEQTLFDFRTMRRSLESGAAAVATGRIPGREAGAGDSRPLVRLGVLSNGNSHPERCGPAGWFSVVVLAQEYGFSEPDPRLYRVPAGAVGVPASRIVMVGDSWRRMSPAPGRGPAVDRARPERIRRARDGPAGREYRYSARTR